MYVVKNRLSIPQDNVITIIYPPTVDWYMLFQRPHQLMRAFATLANVRTIFISTEMYKKLPQPIMKIAEDFYVVSTNANYNHLIKGNKVLWFSYPPHHSLVNDSYDLTVFDAIDHAVDEFADWKPALTQAEQKADLISCSAQIMYDEHVKSGKTIFLCPNGADYEHFKTAGYPQPPPADFPIFNKKEVVVGFHGALATWIDYDIILKVADKYKVVLIGANKYYNTAISHANLNILPHKEYKDLPNYLAQFDVCLAPFKLTEMIKGCDPIKYYEYLSTGKPVITTNMIELVRKYSDVTYFANIDNIHHTIETAINENDNKKQLERIETAKKNTWIIRAEQAIKMVRQQLLKGR